jgi:hypothetical protein
MESKETVRARGKRYRLDKKLKAIEYKGGRCQICAYSRCTAALEFHHSDPSQKDFAINKALSNHWKWDKIKLELEKCILVCANCHREIHENLGY